ncbi:CPBP family glutamic-type intramembrane protease [Streptomyces sp. NPDC048636]|uniref:CPBP family glutamic-type intramembrane protease n=1 Tax=Streptomyces sp. NPDC048636 TaxID=3155762 RepID=UPI00344AA58C
MAESRRGRPGVSRAGALGRALTGGLIMATALGVGNGLGPAIADAVGASGYGARLVPAALVTALALPLVALVHGGRSWRRLGFGGPGASAGAFLAGVGMTAAAAALVLGAATAGGLLRWSDPDPGTLAGFLVSNAVVAILLEALPEETTLRGYTWTSLRGRFGGTVTALATTAVFLLVPGASTVVAAAAARLAGRDPEPMGVAPDGQNPVDYLILIVVFGLTLVAARTALARAPLWTSIGVHLTFLTVNRIALEGGKRHAGWYVEHGKGAAGLLVPVYLLVVAVGFALWGRGVRRRRRREGPAHTASARGSWEVGAVR